MVAIAVCGYFTISKRDLSYLMGAPLISITRVLLPISVSWMILASHTGHGGAFATILNKPFFVHLNKLSYEIYLLNPPVITFLYGWHEQSLHIDPVSMVRYKYLAMKAISTVGQLIFDI